jgi:hypothetical protein
LVFVLPKDLDTAGLKDWIRRVLLPEHYEERELNNKINAGKVVQRWKDQYHKPVDYIDTLEDEGTKENIIDEMLRVRKCMPDSQMYHTVLEAAQFVGCIDAEVGEEHGSLNHKMHVLRYAMYIGQEMEYVLRKKVAVGFNHMLTKMEIAAICFLHNEMRVGTNILHKFASKVRLRFPGNDGTMRLNNLQQAINAFLMSNKDFVSMCEDQEITLSPFSLHDYLGTKESTSNWTITTTLQIFRKLIPFEFLVPARKRFLNTFIDSSISRMFKSNKMLPRMTLKPSRTINH